ncbi:MAG TPA: hypothetical protein VGQ46_12355 [Thermoanaerobaculia bacterium]|jgi:predicted transcriptional regulator|nr:hypothetical protein [Thermoanaerobaculia bacterium]
MTIETKEEVELSPEELAEVNAGIEEAERGEGMDTFEFLKQLVKERGATDLVTT